MSENTNPCSRCEIETLKEDLEIVDVDGLHELCPACLSAVTSDIEYYDWSEKYTREQHERAMQLMEDRDEIYCAFDDYESGVIVVHTPYVSSDVVKDFCDHFQFKITGFGPIWDEESEHKCVDAHGSIFQIVLRYDETCHRPIATEITFIESHIDDLQGNDRQF